MAAADLLKGLESAIPGARVVQPDTEPFSRGGMVVLTGLTKKPELNDQEAEVLGGMEDGRYPIKVVTTGVGIRVKPDNMRRKVKDLDTSDMVNPYDFEGSVKLSYLRHNLSKLFLCRFQRCLGFCERNPFWFDVAEYVVEHYNVDNPVAETRRCL